MKITLSVSAFVLGILLVGAGHARAVSVDSSGEYVVGSPGIVEVTEAAYERDVFMVRDGNDGRVDNVISRHCANFPGPDFCKEGTRIVVTGVNNSTGCSIYSCKDVGNNELMELEQKLKEIYSRIKELKRDAEELHKLIARKKGNKTFPPRPILPPEKRICTTEYAPVCGEEMRACMSEESCKGVQKTYSNRCDAEMHHAMVLYEGACKKNPPTIDPDPRNDVICTREYAPVCAATSVSCGVGDQLCKGAQRTYSNRCEAKAHNAEILYSGACNMGTKELRVKRGTVKRNIYPAQRSKRIMPSVEIMQEDRGEVRRLLPALQKKMLPFERSLVNSLSEQSVEIQTERMPIKRSSRWSVIMDFLRR